MYKVVALDTRQRSGLVRTNRRARKLPALVLKNGAVIKLHPNRPVVVNQEVINLNKKTLDDLKSTVFVSSLEVKEIQQKIEDVIETAVELVVETKDKSLVEELKPEKAEVEVVEEPTPEKAEVEVVEEKPKPKKRGRKRKSRAATESKE